MNLNVVIDLDGVIIDLDFTKFIKKYHPALGWDQLDLKERLILKKLFSLGLSFYSKHAKVRLGASRVINELKVSGDNINILTRRLSSLDNDEKTCEMIKRIIELHLLENDIVYDHIVYTTGNKVKECLELKADVIIEDNPNNILALAQAGFKIICFRTPYNKIIKENGTNIFVAHDWEEVYNRVEAIRITKEQSPFMMIRRKDEEN